MVFVPPAMRLAWPKFYTLPLTAAQFVRSSCSFVWPFDVDFYVCVCVCVCLFVIIPKIAHTKQLLCNICAELSHRMKKYK